MNEQMKSLARELRDLVPLEDPRWEGAQVVYPVVQEPVRIVGVDDDDPYDVDVWVYVPDENAVVLVAGLLSSSDDCDWVEYWPTALPDLDDPATLGCLLALVREALDWPSAAAETRWGRSRVVRPWGSEAWECRPWVVGGEIAALVAALREAKRHE